MFKSALANIRTHLVTTVAAAVCMVVAVVALGFTVHDALLLVVIPVAASALTALIFFLLAVLALVFLQFSARKPVAEEPVARGGIWSSIDWNRIAPLVGEVGLDVAAIVADRVRRRRDDRRRDRGR
jgi:hypothetical protein